MCDHEHNDICDECTNLRITFEEIKHAISSSIDDNQVSGRLLAKFITYQEAIDAWKCHLLRTVNQDLCRQEILETLVNDSVYIYMGWAMKWLPEKYREGQSSFFGKRGLSWPISVVVRVNEQAISNPETNAVQDASVEDENAYIYLIIVHVFDQCMQDSEAVIAILRDVLIRTKRVDSSIKMLTFAPITLAAIIRHKLFSLYLGSHVTAKFEFVASTFVILKEEKDLAIDMPP